MGKHTQRTGLKKKIIFSILWVGLATGLIGLSLAYFSGKYFLSRVIGSNFKKFAQVTSDNIENTIRLRIEEGHLLASSHAVLVTVEDSNSFYEGSTEEEIHQRLLEVEERWVYAQGVNAHLLEVLNNLATTYLTQFSEKNRESGGPLLLFATNERGAVVAATQKTSHYYFGEEKWWQQAFQKGEGRLYISDLEESEDRSGRTLIIATPIQKGGRSIGVVTMIYDVASFLGTATASKIGKTDLTLIAGSDGNLIFNPASPGETQPLPKALTQIIQSGGSGWASTNDDPRYPGQEAITGFAPVSITFKLGEGNFGGKNWTVFTSQDPQETFAPVYTLLQWMVFIGLLGSGVLGFLGFVAARRIVKPIEELQRGTERIGEGDLNYRIHLETHDEIEDLANKFNEMTYKVKLAHIGLEEQVKERTKELEQQKKELFVLYSIASALNKSLHLDEILQETLKRLLELTHADAGLVWLSTDEKGGKFSLAATRDLRPDLPQNENLLKLVDHVGHVILKSGSFWTSENLSSDERVSDLPFWDIGFMSVSGIPLISKGKVLGVCYLLHKNIHALTSKETILLSTIGTQIGIAIEHSLLFAKHLFKQIEDEI